MPVYVAIFVLGIIGGALVNYLADVLPVTRTFAHPFCRSCGQRFKLLTYLVFPRRCSSCQNGRGWRTAAVEILMGGAALWLWVQPPRLGFWAGFLLLLYLTLVAVIDLEHKLILHPVSLVGAAIAFSLGSWLHGLAATLIGGVVGFGTFILFYWAGIGVGKLLGRIRGEEFEDEALGFGDVILAGVLGLLLGWPGIVLGLVLGVLIGGIGSAVVLAAQYLLGQRKRYTIIPYGPFLIAGAGIIIYFQRYLLALGN